MHIQLMNIAGNPNVGLYAFANDHICFVGSAASEEEVAELKETLQVPVVQVNICGTPLVGIFATGNNEVIFVPDVIFDKEYDEMKKAFDRVVKVPTNNTALGNNIFMTDKGCIASPDMEANVISLLEEQTKLPVTVKEIAKLPTVGSLLVANTKGGIISHDASDDEVATLEKELGVPCTIGTINFGSSFISSGLVCNSNGVIVGASSTGVEVNNVDEGLGFLDA